MKTGNNNNVCCRQAILKHNISYSRSLLLILFSLLFCLQAYPQGKEANIWYFGNHEGLDFNQGSPPAILSNGQTVLVGKVGTACISDSNGNLLFYSGGVTIWNKNHVVMQNGDNIGGHTHQCGVIVPLPESPDIYYFFSFNGPVGQGYMNLIYSVIDMSLDNGLGGVVEGQKSIPIWNYVNQITAVSHANGHDFWVITHGYYDDRYLSFLVSSDGLNTTPVASNAGSQILSGGILKVSPNGEKIALSKNNGPYYDFFELLDFDNETGIIDDSNIVRKNTAVYGIEFSPDNSRFYSNGGGPQILQYDLNAGTPQQILDSEVSLYTGQHQDGALQIGPDGKIYCYIGQYYLSVIHEPNKPGLACNFELDAIDMNGFLYSRGFPTFIQSYLKDPAFNTQHNCLGDATAFEITETNGIDSVFWKFNDFPNMPNDTSTLFNPSYTFSNAGTFFVDLTVYSGLLEKTVTQEVIIHPLPEPNLGNDTLFCDTSFSITLKANCYAAFYSWSTGAFGVPEITVSDTGTYWVRATSDQGCIMSDTIHVGLFPQPQLDETNLTITDTDCGQSNGSIIGIQVTGNPPLQFYWLDFIGDTIATTLDVVNLLAGQYTLVVTDGNGCTHSLNNYIVYDNGSLQIDSISYTNAHCNQSMGTITVFTDSPTPELLYYFINADSAQNNGVFTDLLPGSYNIMIKDNNGCTGVYNNNPIVIENIGGPILTATEITAEDNFESNGSINLTANLISGGDINYSIYNGNNPQLNNGLFENLSAGIYNCKVWDDFGCDTIFEIIVPRNSTILLEAISGFGNTCVGETAVSPLELNNFNDVFFFEVKISYDINVVNCDGYINLNPALAEGFQANIIPSLGEVHLSWQGQSPISLEDHSLLAELVFGGLGEGISPVYWEAGPGESNFYNQNMDTINAICYVGDVQIYSLPEIQMQSYEDVCSGDTLLISPEISGNNGEVDYLWTGPNGFTSQSIELSLKPVNTEQSGIYTLLVEDTMFCQKSQSIEINIKASPEIAFSQYDTLWVEPEYELDAGAGTEYYQWNTGETTEIITIDTTGLYSVEVISYENCKSYDTVQILWGGLPFYIPNAFTPNGDGLNDTFGVIPKYDYIKKYHMSIYNRWGQLIFETTSINKLWDGTFKGTQCMSGVYVYKIVYEEFGQQSISNKHFEGTVTLLK